MNKVDNTGKAVVDADYFWQPITTCPRALKVQLLSKYGVAVYGIYNGTIADAFYTHWAPMPKKPKDE